MEEKQKDSSNKNNQIFEQILKGKYTCEEDKSKTLEVTAGTITFSSGEIIKLENVWGIQGEENIIDPGVISRFTKGYEVDFYKGGLRTILTYKKD